MNLSTKHIGLALAALFGIAVSLSAQQASITIDVNKPGVRIARNLWGIFFEDINCSADGGLYPERIRNRSFEDTDTPSHWSVLSIGSAKLGLALSTEHPLSAK